MYGAMRPSEESIERGEFRALCHLFWAAEGFVHVAGIPILFRDTVVDVEMSIDSTNETSIFISI